MKNSKDPRVKYSSVERLMNKSLIFIFIFQIVLCLISAILRGVYFNKNLKEFNKRYKIKKMILKVLFLFLLIFFF
jgi:hypothetical protein